MPQWGLTREQRETRPWGLESDLLNPYKIVTDPVHSDIYLTVLETKFLDTEAMQRLRRVRQLGTTHLVYPGASHSRLAHSLGTLRVAQDLLDTVVSQRDGLHPATDLFVEWSAETRGDPIAYSKRVAEATVLTRLAALLHDMCHISFGHSLEDDLQLLKPHDANEERFRALWKSFGKIGEALPTDLAAAVKAIVLSKVPHDQSVFAGYDFAYDIVGNTICADLIDYLARDHRSSGLPALLGRRFINGFYVTPSSEIHYPRRMAIKLRRGARLRSDVVSELFKYLRYRYELSERVLVHHAKLAADAMIGKALEMWADSLEAGKTPSRRTRSTPQNTTLALVADAHDRPRDIIESELIRRGDDGLLEYLRDLTGADARISPVSKLASGILERKLYKPIARSDDASRALADETFRKFGSAEARRKLELEAAKYAVLPEGWWILLWVPKPDMRLKAAEVLVNDGRAVLPLDEFDRATSRRGTEIYDSHQALWAVSLYVHPDVPDLKREVIRRFLSPKLGITWASDLDAIQPSPLIQLAAKEVAGEVGLTRADEEELVVESAAFGATPTWEGLLGSTRMLARKKKSAQPRQGREAE